MLGTAFYKITDVVTNMTVFDVTTHQGNKVFVFTDGTELTIVKRQKTAKRNCMSYSVDVQS